MFSLREKQLLFNLSFEQYVPSKELAEYLSVSNKTIYRIVNKINDITQQEYHEQLILAETGKGYILNNHFIEYNFVAQLVESKDEVEIYGDLIKLLFKHPHKVRRTYLEIENYYSKSSISRKLSLFQRVFSMFDIHLHMDGEFLWLAAEEDNIRRAIRFCLNQHQIDQLIADTHYKLSDYDRIFIQKQINLVEDTLGEVLNYPYNELIFSHIFMVLMRYREGKVEVFQSQFPITREEIVSMQQLSNITNLSERIVEAIEQYLVLELSRYEVLFLFKLINSMNVSWTRHRAKEIETIEVMAEGLIARFFDAEYDTNYQELKSDLVSHLFPMITRLENGISIENKMLSEIKLEYSWTFDKLGRIFQSGILPYLVDENEIGYLTLYFEKYLLSLQHRYRVLIVCSSGVGVSELLRIKVQRQFPYLEIFDSWSLRRLIREKRALMGRIDFIISSITIAETLDFPVVHITPLMVKSDIEKIEYAINERVNPYGRSSTDCR